MGGGSIEGKNKNTSVSCWRSKQMCFHAEYAKHIHIWSEYFGIILPFCQLEQLILVVLQQEKPHISGESKYYVKNKCEKIR